ncbi:hypothetical protein F0562_006963 [Nyssa sinensis]|uniref:DUF4371 domain-containing protein n=1 Tax=Nyssa sinensis TaxID=561372 RepID=A0A5J5A2R7_9ASTE|nr:hypothetical protein F0562_006963 [Nyssa sinensis]
MTTIESVRWLAFQGCAFRENAPRNARYTSPQIQKENLHILSNKVRNKIRDEVGDAKFCILVDEARDESNREQMAIVLRFVDDGGFVREHFFEVVSVEDTTTSTLKKKISNVLTCYNLHIRNISIVNLVSISSKHHNELQSAQAVEISHMLATGECETSKGANQIVPQGLTSEEMVELEPLIQTYHTYEPIPHTCTSLITQRIDAPVDVVWPLVRQFDNPQKYKHFIKSCKMISEHGDVGSIREVTVISGLPASTSTERLEMLDDEKRILSFRVVGGEHRLNNYRSVTSVNEFNKEGKVYSIVLESYIVDIPAGNTGEDTKMFTDTVVKLNLQKLAVVAMASLHGQE